MMTGAHSISKIGKSTTRVLSVLRMPFRVGPCLTDTTDKAGTESAPTISFGVQLSKMGRLRVTPLGLARQVWVIALGGLLTVAGCSATDTPGGHEIDAHATLRTLPDLCASPNLPEAPVHQVTADLPVVPAADVDDRPLPINLPTALQLANVRAADVSAAAERIRAAGAALRKAEVLWLPTITLGGDYNHHDGKAQDASGNVIDNSHSGLMFGAGTGIGAAAVLDVDEAIFAPLAAKQQVRAREADLQTASNDTMLAVTEAYFNVQQARGEAAGAMETTRRTQDLIHRTRLMAPALVPELEIFRAETELARREQAELLARERWKVASAELLRLLRVDPSAQVEPTEPPQLRIELIDLAKPVDDLIPIALMNRPELAAQQAQVQATLVLMKQEKLRPLIPSILLRGASTPVTGTLAGGYFAGGPGGNIGDGGARGDFDLQVLWQLNNLGFGNRASIQQREAENRVALVELLKREDRVAAEVAQAYAQAQQAGRRVEVAERGLRNALASADKNLIALGQTKGAGNQVVTLVRPQEVVAAVQALGQAYVDYYGAVADANRAQFRLYRALGEPAQCLIQEHQDPLCAPAFVPDGASKPAGAEFLPAPQPLRDAEESRKQLQYHQ
jgi:outer membrane protein TolC